MDNLPKNLAELRLYLANVRPWALIAAIAALIVVGFYSLEGYRYWEAWDASRTMNAEIERINAKLDRGMPKVEGSADDLDRQEQRLAYFEGMFNQKDVSRLIGIASTTSWDSGIELPSITSGDPTFEEVGDATYETQGLTITAEGDINDMYQFMSDLHRKLPNFVVNKVTISSPGPEASAQFQLNFFLLPREDPTSEDEAAD